ncbi:MAG: lamin tail domain-containing protein [Rubricoccaceae bacterium]
MRLRPLLPALALLAGLSWPAAVAGQAPAPADLVINEIMYDPPAGQPSTNEWVELVNRSERVLDLSTVLISDGGTPARLAATPVLLAPGAYVVLVRNAAAFAEAFPDVPHRHVPGFPALNNTGDRVALLTAAGEIDAVPYARTWGGVRASLERRDPDGPGDDAANWATTTDARGGTPGAPNTQYAPDRTPPTLAAADALDAYTLEATFSERVTPASASDAARYRLETGTPPVLAAEPQADGRRVRLVLGAPLAGPATHVLVASGIADVAGNVQARTEAAFAFGEGDVPRPGDLVVNEFLYAEPPEGSPGEWVELYNRSERTFDLADFTLNDDSGPDEPITSRRVLVPPGGYAVVVQNGARFSAAFPDVPHVAQAAWSALNNAGDAIVLRYGGALIDSLRYAPSWGGAGRSLERRDPAGPSGVPSSWATTTDARGGTPGALNTQYAPDLEGPRLAAVRVRPSERELVAVFDEPLDPASVHAERFDAGPGVARATLSASGRSVALALRGRLGSGPHTLHARGLRDRLGNETSEDALGFAHASDTTPPHLVSAEADGPAALVARFSEPLAAGADEPAHFALDAPGLSAGALRPVVAIHPAGADSSRVRLVFADEFPPRTLLRLTAHGVADRAGNSAPPSRAELLAGEADVPSPGEIVLTEIMYDPATGSAGEYVELHNRTPDRVFDLSRLALDKGTPGTTTLAAAPVPLMPGAYLAVARDLAGFRQTFPEAPAVQGRAFPALGNGGDLVVLRLAGAAGAALDSVRYEPRWHRPELLSARGVALERRSPQRAAALAANWSSSLDARGGTPGQANSVSARPDGRTERVGIHPAPPFDPDGGEAAVISYTLAGEAGLVRIRLFDGGGRLVRELEPGRLSGAQGSVLWDGRDDAGRPLRTGAYVVLLEAVDVAAGTTEAHRGVVVLGRR